MTKGKLCEMLIHAAQDYRREGVLKSLKRNKHMSKYQGEHVKDNVIDALLVDFINYVGRRQGLDLGLYTRHLDEDEKINECYYENSVTIILSVKGTRKINKELKNYKCRICGGSLMLVNMMKESFIMCSHNKGYHSSNCGYHIDMSDQKKYPTIKKD